MEIVVDGAIFQCWPHGGIARIYSEILPRMCDINDGLRITLFSTGVIKQPLPTHTHISHRSLPEIERYLRPGRLWRPVAPHVKKFVFGLQVRRARGRIWHSTYYTMPVWQNEPLVVTVADMIYERFPELFNRPVDDQFREHKRHCILTADAVICISETTGKDLREFYGVDSEKVWVVPLGCSDVFTQTENIKTDPVWVAQKPFFLYVGDRARYKNFRLLTKAYSLWKRRGEVDLVVVGRQWSPEEKDQLMAVGIADQVHLVGRVDDGVLATLYGAAKALVYPSLYEGFGLPVLEAMACGCPVIASRIASTVEVGADCPIYFDPGQVEDLIVALDRALTEGRGSARCGMGLTRVKEFSWEKSARETLKVYEAIKR